MREELRRIVLEKLRLKWSPEQISGRLSLHKIAQISHEIPCRFLRSHPCFKRYRKRATLRTEPIASRVDISQRPDIVEKKCALAIGNWVRSLAKAMLLL